MKKLELKTVLVTGGTGFIGTKLCCYLIKKGFLVYVLTRKLLKSTQSIKYIQSLDELIEVDIIINLAGDSISRRWTQKAKRSILDSRINTTRNIIECISKIKPKILINGSAVGYYGTDLNKTFYEESEASGKDGFAKYLCKSWEDEVKNAGVLIEDLRIVYLRIGPVIDKNGGLLSKMLPSFYMGLGGKIGDGMQWISWIDLDDLISLILYIIANDKIHGPVNATAPHPIRNIEFSLKLAQVIRRPCIFTIPSFILKMIFGEMAQEIMLEGQKALPKKSLSFGFEFSYPHIEKSFEKLSPQQ